jgi:hypothetical protein
MSKARDLANAGTALTTVSATELGYLDGVTSAVQTQIDSKIGSASAINPTIVDAKGDIVAATAADTVARLAVGANDTVLTADSSTATGLKWATPAAGANWSLLNAGGTALTGATTITVSGISNKDKIMILVAGASSASAQSIIGIRLNADSGSNYGYQGYGHEAANTYSSGSFFQRTETADSRFRLGNLASNAASTLSGYCLLSGCASSGVKIMNSVGGATNGGGSEQQSHITGGVYNSSSAISSISVVSSSGNFDAGTVFVYTSA